MDYKKEEILFEMLKKDNFEYVGLNNCYDSLEDLLSNVCISKLEAFKLAISNRNNQYIDEGCELYEYDSNIDCIYQYTQEDIVEKIDNVDEFIQFYKESYGEDDELYLDYFKECI